MHGCKSLPPSPGYLFLTPDNMDSSKKLYEALKAITSNPHANLSDLIYHVRDSENKGWNGRWVKQWNKAVEKVESALKLYEEQSK